MRPAAEPHPQIFWTALLVLALHSIAIKAQTENNQGLPNLVDREALGCAGHAGVVLAPFGTDRERIWSIWTPHLGEDVAGGIRTIAHPQHETRHSLPYLEQYHLHHWKETCCIGYRENRTHKME